MAYYKENKNNGGQVSERTNGAKQRSEKKKKNNNSKYRAKQVLFFLVIFWTISSIVAWLCAFGVTDMIAKADTVTNYYVYEGNNLFLVSPVGIYEEGSSDLPPYPNNYYMPFSFDLRLQIVDSVYANNYFILVDKLPMPLIKCSGGIPDIAGHGIRRLDTYSNPYAVTEYERYYITDTDYYNTFETEYSDGYFYGSAFIGYLSSYYFTYYAKVDYICNADFNCNVQYIQFSSSIRTQSNSSHGTYYAYENNITYCDFYGNLCDVKFTCYSTSETYARFSMFEPRTYYLDSSSTSDAYYQQGFNNGYAEGKKDFDNSGWQDGYNQGQIDGYNQGKIDGIESANQYTFLGLIGAVVDAPLNALRSMFGWELLGVNLLDLISGLFTLLFVILILRLIFGGKD